MCEHIPKRAMEVEAWPGDWGLASSDAASLAVLTYLRFTGDKHRVTVRKNGQTWDNLRVELPFLRDEDGDILTTAPRIISEIRRRGLNIDGSLSLTESSKALAFANLVEDALAPVLALLLVLDAENYSAATSKIMSKLTFPLNMICPRFYTKRALRTVDDQTELEIFTKADRCLSSLNVLLGEKNFFFGAKPSYLDAIAFGYIAVLRNAPITQTRLHQQLQDLTMLNRWVDRVQAMYFPEILAYTAPSRVSSAMSERDRRKAIIWCSGAGGLMLAFAFSLGIHKKVFA
eukprot:m.62686 g.62686  ORF g.62686 m.62686 type:complete len:288 (+) comp7414_c0_seq1:47-910(+)